MNRNDLINTCKELVFAYKQGDLGQTVMPEDSHPKFVNKEERLSYFTLPMALNYQRDSYKLWESALKTWNDPKTRWVFNVAKVDSSNEDDLRKALTKYKLALQPNKHIDTWSRICSSIYTNWGSIEGLINAVYNDFLKLKDLVQIEYKKGFPYLSGPKIFNYWSFILTTY